MYHLLVSGSSSSSATSVCPASPRSAPPSPEPMMDLEPAHSVAPATARQEKPIFTLKQMTMIAERMCKVRQIMVTFLHLSTRLRIWSSFGSWILICISAKIKYPVVFEAQKRALEGRGRSQWRPGGSKWSPAGFSIEQWAQIPIVWMRSRIQILIRCDLKSWIRIRIRVKSWNRIRIKLKSWIRISI